mmetsp:Transcript_120727/g.348837  ORF Transcript_120727/g.348837 Transcript_120727/m.348837 type:complete len:237 (-) Transcript_120727:692-1402(-)
MRRRGVARRWGLARRATTLAESPARTAGRRGVASSLGRRASRRTPHGPRARRSAFLAPLTSPMWTPRLGVASLWVRQPAAPPTGSRTSVWMVMRTASPRGVASARGTSATSRTITSACARWLARTPGGLAAPWAPARRRPPLKAHGCPSGRHRRAPHPMPVASTAVAASAWMCSATRRPRAGRSAGSRACRAPMQTTTTRLGVASRWGPGAMAYPRRAFPRCTASPYYGRRATRWD